MEGRGGEPSGRRGPDGGLLGPGGGEPGGSSLVTLRFAGNEQRRLRSNFDDRVETPTRWWRGRGPFEGQALIGVVACYRSPTGRDAEDQIGDDDEDAEGDQRTAGLGQPIQALLIRRGARDQAQRHTVVAKEVVAHAGTDEADQQAEPG